jgi:hypothetical protein
MRLSWAESAGRSGVKELLFSASRFVDLVTPRAKMTDGGVIPSDDSVLMYSRVFVGNTASSYRARRTAHHLDSSGKSERHRIYRGLT